MRLIIASALMASAAVATPAFAQDAPDKPFQGPSVTAIVGVDKGSASTGLGQNDTGVVYGGQIGYDIQSGKTVFGVEGEITGASTKSCSPGGIVAGDRFCDKAGRDLYAGARLGYVVGNSTMVYVKGGYTNARENFDYRDGGAGTTNYSGSGVRGGVRGGVGVETLISKNVVAKAEYRYSNYSNTDYSRNQGVVGLGFKF